MEFEKLLKKFLPLTEATYYIMLSLVEPLHGYGIMQYVEEISGGRVKLGPGTLYGAIGKLEKEKIISITMEVDRKKCYQLTAEGRLILAQEIRRLGSLYEHGKSAIEKLEKENNEL